MECPLKSGEGIELIIGYAARSLEPEIEAALERHLQICADCREVAVAQGAVWSALDDLPPVAVSNDFDERLYRRIAQEEQRSWWQRLLQANWSWRPAVPVAAACAVLVAAFLVKNNGRDVPAPVVQPKLQIEQVEHELDDMDMLKQAGVESMPEKGATRDKG